MTWVISIAIAIVILVIVWLMMVSDKFSLIFGAVSILGIIITFLTIMIHELFSIILWK